MHMETVSDFKKVFVMRSGLRKSHGQCDTNGIEQCVQTILWKNYMNSVILKVTFSFGIKSLHGK